MKWFWVSRRAYDLAIEERDRLRVQVDGVIDTLTRIQRAQMGMSEVPRQRKERVVEPMPPEVYEYIERTANPSLRSEQKRVVWRRHGTGESWDSILEDIQKQEGDGVQLSEVG